jgi:hypothetical protein
MLAGWQEHSESSIPGPSITSLHQATSAGTSFALTPTVASSSSFSLKRHNGTIGDTAPADRETVLSLTLYEPD